MKILSALASLTFALSLSAAPAFAHGHDAKSAEITHKGGEKACCKKKHDERCEKDSTYAEDSAQCAKMDKEQCRKHREQCMKDSAAADSSSPVAKQAIKPAKAKK